MDAWRELSAPSYPRYELSANHSLAVLLGALRPAPRTGPLRGAPSAEVRPAGRQARRVVWYGMVWMDGWMDAEYTLDGCERAALAPVAEPLTARSIDYYSTSL